MKKNKKQKPHYVDNKMFLQAMIDWRETWPDEDNIPPVTNYIGECFLKIAKRALKNANSQACRKEQTTIRMHLLAYESDYITMLRRQKH